MEPVHVFHINVLFGKNSKIIHFMVKSCGLAGGSCDFSDSPAPPFITFVTFGRLPLA